MSLKHLQLFSLFVLLVPLLHLDASAQNVPATELKNLSYTFSSTPNVNDALSDAKMSALTDDDAKTKVAWHDRPQVDVDFDLQGMRHLSEVSVRLYRPNPGWFLGQISLYLDAGQGYQLADRIQTGQVSNAPIKDNYQTFTFQKLDRDALRARVRFEKGGYFAVTDIQFFAAPVKSTLPPAPAGTGPAPQYKFPAQPETATIEETNLDDDSDKELLLANRYMSVVIEPDLGGVISAIQTPRGVSYTPARSLAHPAGGMLKDLVASQQVSDGDWSNGPYQYEILNRGPKQVSVRLWRRGSSGVLAYLTFSKTITLYADRSNVDVDYSIENAPEALAPLPESFWFHNFAGVPGWQKPGTLHYFYPTQQGVKQMDPASKAKGDDWVLGPTRGWTALLDVPRQAGLAFSMDYRYLASFYNWWAPNSEMPTLEWRFFEVPVPAGGSFKTRIVLQPYAGLSKVSGVSDQAVGEIAYAQDEIQTKIVPNFSGSAKVLLQMRRLPETQWQNIKTQQLELKAGQMMPVNASVKLPGDGTYVLSAALVQGDKTIFSMETPQTEGNPSGTYALAPLEEQYKPEGKQSLNLQYTSMDVKTPHVDWATPYHQGKTKAVLFTANYLDRDIIELAQRMDLNFDTSYIYPVYLLWGLGDYLSQHAASQADLLAGLKDLWNRSGDWQVLVLPGEAWQYLPDTDRQMILAKVREGRGLVLIEPADAGELPVSGRGKVLSQATWEKGAPHYITRGVPFSLLPPTDVETYAQHEGDALITAQGQPVLSVGNVGKGRVAVFEYRAGADTTSKERPAGLLPMAYSENKDVAPLPTNSRYYEYQFSLLIRSVLWASHQESPVALDNAAIDDTSTKLTITNPADAMPGQVTWIIRDINGQQVGNGGAQNVTLNKGTQNISIHAPLPLEKGSMDIWIRDAQGRVMDGGTYPFSMDVPVKLEKVTLGANHLTPDGTLSLKVLLSGQPPAGTHLHVKLTDGFGRIVSNQSMPADAQEQNVTVTWHHLLNRIMNIRVSLGKDREWDSSLSQLPVQFPLRVSAHDNTEPYLLPWTGSAVSNRGFNAYLFEPIAQQLRKLGANAAIVNPQERMMDSVLNSLGQANMDLFMKGSGIGDDHPAKGSDPDHPTRASEIYDTLEGAKKTVAEYAGDYAARNAVEYIAGDEGHLAERGVEMSFAPGYLAQFRLWLQKRYNNLEELNRQWGTSFAGWDQVMPLTLQEIRAKNSTNFSSWCDFRAFGDDTVANYNGQMAETADTTVPNFRLSISGTPYPTPYFGYDYWRLSHALTGIQVYSGLDQMADFAGRNVDLMIWSNGHGEPPSGIKFSIFDPFFRGATGISIWPARLLFKPDLRYSTFGQPFVDYYKPIRDGVGRLLIGSHLQRDRVAVLYSQNPMRVAYALDEYDLWQQSNESAMKLLQNIGFDPAWISYDQLAEGKTDNYKVLLLPASSSLSDAEVAAVKQFVQNGGTVIGAMRTGIADGRGKMQNQGSLDELFGIQRKGTELARGQFTLIGNSLNGISVSTYETGIAATGAQVEAKTSSGIPVVFHRNAGKGQVWYLACDVLPQYANFNAARTVKDNAVYTNEIETLTSQWMSAAGVIPLVRVNDAQGKPLPFVKRSHFVDGPVNYYTVLRDYPTAASLSVKPQMAEITLPSKQYVYEVLSGKSYGLTDHVQTIIANDSTMIFAALPYHVTGLNITSNQKQVMPGQPAILQFSVQTNAKAATHILHVDVIDPSGNSSDVYSQNLTAYQGKATMTLPFALNDEPGKWIVRVHDLTSGAKGEIALLMSKT